MEPDISELNSLEESMWLAQTRYDPHWIERYFHPDFIEFGCSGRIYHFEDLLREDLASYPTTIASQLPLPNFTLARLDRCTALLTYDSHVKYDEGMQHAHRMSVWLHNADHWQMRRHQGTLFVPGS